MHVAHSAATFARRDQFLSVQCRGRKAGIDQVFEEIIDSRTRDYFAACLVVLFAAAALDHMANPANLGGGSETAATTAGLAGAGAGADAVISFILDWALVHAEM